LSLKLFLLYLKEKFTFLDEIYIPELISLITNNSSPIVFIVSWIVWLIILNGSKLETSKVLVFGLLYPGVLLWGYLIWRDYQDWLDQMDILSFIQEEEEEEIG